jgi:hypothetical protein
MVSLADMLNSEVCCSLQQCLYEGYSILFTLVHSVSGDVAYKHKNLISKLHVMYVPKCLCNIPYKRSVLIDYVRIF